MELVSTIIALISGAVGGNVAGAAMPEKNLGGLINTIAGLVGGGAGQFIIKALGLLASANVPGMEGTTHGLEGISQLDFTSILASIGAGGVGGGALTAIVALIKDAMQKK